jgi:hypothetical protein
MTNVQIDHNRIDLTAFGNSQNWCIVTESATLIDSNYCTTADQGGIKFATSWNSIYGRGPVTVRNNLVNVAAFQNPAGSAHLVTAETTAAYHWHDGTLLNNTFVGGDGDTGNFINNIVSGDMDTSSVFKNNIVLAIGKMGSGTPIILGPTSHSNNLIFSTVTPQFGGYYWRTVSGVGCTDTVSCWLPASLHSTYETSGQITDPLLVSTASPGVDTDLKLSSNASPAYNAGVDPSGSFTDDYFGNTRPQFTTWDIGANEFCTGGGCSSPPPTTGHAGRRRLRR